MEKEQLFEKRMIELSKNAYYRGILTFSDFLDLNELHKLHSLPLKQYGVKVELLEDMRLQSVRWQHLSLMLFL